MANLEQSFVLDRFKEEHPLGKMENILSDRKFSGQEWYHVIENQKRHRGPLFVPRCRIFEAILSEEHLSNPSSWKHHHP